MVGVTSNKNKVHKNKVGGGVFPTHDGLEFGVGVFYYNIKTKGGISWTTEVVVRTQSLSGGVPQG